MEVNGEGRALVFLLAHARASRRFEAMELIKRCDSESVDERFCHRAGRFDSMAFGLVSFGRVTVDSSIQVGVRGPTVWVKVEGKGSFLNSGNLKEFAREMLDRGYREFVVDLGGLRHDGFHIHGNDGQRGVAAEGNRPWPSSYRSLRKSQPATALRARIRSDIRYPQRRRRYALNVKRLSEPPEASHRIPEKRKQAETMLEAHEALCEAAPENIFRFKDVLDFLRQDLHHETSSK